ncbi:hypothetical protein FIBSPDRAFT_979397 [Athelia psychrophila]|uniref:Uncharacterized protein n=1 Tax=Athelia psychrophila TaxID=1759441 RepID=A0A166DMF0_9AGAM|nr:hypothetical protein FIBSPDRAFT_979397 [Fibularhizoctonia sp. CBS 109695]
MKNASPATAIGRINVSCSARSYARNGEAPAEAVDAAPALERVRVAPGALAPAPAQARQVAPVLVVAQEPGRRRRGLDAAQGEQVQAVAQAAPGRRAAARVPVPEDRDHEDLVGREAAAAEAAARAEEVRRVRVPEERVGRALLGALPGRAARQGLVPLAHGRRARRHPALLHAHPAEVPEAREVAEARRVADEAEVRQVRRPVPLLGRRVEGRGRVLGAEAREEAREAVPRHVRVEDGGQDEGPPLPVLTPPQAVGVLGHGAELVREEVVLAALVVAEARHAREVHPPAPPQVAADAVRDVRGPAEAAPLHLAHGRGAPVAAPAQLGPREGAARPAREGRAVRAPVALAVQEVERAAALELERARLVEELARALPRRLYARPPLALPLIMKLQDYPVSSCLARRRLLPRCIFCLLYDLRPWDFEVRFKALNVHLFQHNDDGRTAGLPTSAQPLLDCAPSLLRSRLPYETKSRPVSGDALLGELWTVDYDNGHITQLPTTTDWNHQGITLDSF